MAAPRVIDRRASMHEAELREPPQQAAQVAGVETEVTCELGRGGPSAMRDLVEDATFGEGEGALEMMFVENADAASVESVEAAYCGDTLADLGLRHNALR